jgi:hypothetical protein
MDYADEKRREANEAHEEDENRQFGKDAYRAFNMFARDHGWDSGKVKVPTIQGADITPSGVSI